MGNKSVNNNYSIDDIPKLYTNCEENNNLYMRNQIDAYKMMLDRCIKDFELYAELQNLSVQERIKHPRFQEYRNVLQVRDSYKWRYHEQAHKLMSK